MLVGARAALVPLVIAAFALGGPTALASASTFDEVSTLAPSDGATGDEFGQAVALSGNTMVVGAPMDKDGTVYQYGAAFVYSQTSPGAWTLEQTLHPTVGDDHVDEFGSSVAVDPDGTIVVGAPSEDTAQTTSTETGAAWVFQPNGSGGYTQQELTGSSEAGSQFGSSVAIEGTTIVVGAPDDSPNGSISELYGAAYAFTQTTAGQSFSLAAAITLASPETDDLFGDAVAINGQTIVVGAPGYSSGAGLVASYNEPSTSDDWASPDLTATQLTGPSGAGNFGNSLAVSTNVVYSGGTFETGSTTLVVGAPGTSEGSTEDVGAAFVYGLPSSGDITGLSDEAELQPTVANTSPEYGNAVAIDGATIGVAPSSTGNEIYAYSEPGGGWSNSATGTEVEPTSPTAPLGDGAVAVSGNVFAFGAPSAVSSGFVYVFDQPATTVAVSLSPGSIPADGTSTSLATAAVADAAGDPVTDDQLAFTASDSQVRIGSVTNNGDGSYTATITGDTNPGNVTITATDSTPSTPVSGDATLVQTGVQVGTSTSLVSSANPAVFGQSVTLTATVAAGGSGSPTGTVSFSDNGTQLGTGTLSTSSGVTTATLTLSTLIVGTHPITASYGGNSDFGGSGSQTLDQTINAASTTTSLVSSANPAVFGQSVTLTATVAVVAPGQGSPTGTVTFYDNGSQLGTPVLVSTTGGVTSATFTLSTLIVGTHPITASYGGNSDFGGSGSQTLDQTINAASTTTSLVSSANPAVFGQSVTLTATVAVVAPGQGSPTGTVTFYDNGSQLGTPVLVSTTGGVTSATFTLSTLIVGTHPITASYGGNSSFDASSSQTLDQTVNAASTTTSLVSSANPAVFGQSVTLTATVAVVAPGQGSPTGTVTFYDNGSQLGTPVLVSTTGGVTSATFTLSSFAVGTHPITVSYSGSSSFDASSSQILDQTVNAVGTTSTSLVSSANPAVFGQSVTLTATVAAVGSGTPTGTVTFYDNGSQIGTPVLVSTTAGVTSATLTASSFAVGAQSITASYGGSSNFDASSSQTLDETINAASTTTSLVSSANPAVFGQSVTLTATVAVVAPGQGSPTGTVSFSDNGTQLGTGTLSTSSGVTTATLTLSTLAVGTHPITASYDGSSNFDASSSRTLDQTVNAASTTTSLVSSANPAVFGQSVTLTATVAVVAPGQGSPTGTVSFSDNGTQLGTGTLSTSSGVTTATLTLSTLAVGTHPITASYDGSSNFDASSSRTLDQTVKAANTAVGLGHVSTHGIKAVIPASCREPADQTCRFTVTLKTTEVLHDGKLVAVTAGTKHSPRTTTKTVMLGATLIVLTGGKNKEVRITLNSAGKRLLSARHSLEATVVVSEAGTTVTSEVVRLS